MNYYKDIATILKDKGLDKNRDLLQKRLHQITTDDVENALSLPAGTYSLEKLIALISPAAETYLEQMAVMSRQLTIQRFGRTIKLYAPLYLSNFCVNSCRYCGFNKNSDFKRTRLTVAQALAEAQRISETGFKDILLVSGEDRSVINIDYLVELAKGLRDKFSSISIEIYQATESEYAELFKAGIEGVTFYQETYNHSAYDYFHCAGAKADYQNRLKGPDSIAAAGMRQIGLGALLGLTDWRSETLALAEHGHYIMKRYWKSHISFSFPRLRPANDVGQNQFKHLLEPKNLVQMITALRLCFADADLVLSTREPAAMRDSLINLGITRLSAGSKTSPGGYSGNQEAVKQFEIDDTRTPTEVAQMIRRKGMEPVWKDWDKAFAKT